MAHLAPVLSLIIITYLTLVTIFDGQSVKSHTTLKRSKINREKAKNGSRQSTSDAGVFCKFPPTILAKKM
jgi:hypothetical protein